MIVFIDGENFRQNLAQILTDEKYIKNKDDFFKYDVAGLMKNALGAKNLKIKYYASEIRTPNGYKPSRNTLRQLTKIREKMRKWVPVLKQQSIEYIKAGNLKIKEGKECYKCHTKTEVLQEKGVDVRLALDILEQSAKKNCRQIAILSSDTDLCPAYHKAKSRRTKLIYICFDTKVNRAVSAVCDKTIEITNEDIKRYFIKSV